MFNKQLEALFAEFFNIQQHQLYEYGMKGIRELRRTVENVAKGLLESLRREPLAEEDLIYKRRRIEKNIE